jgi:hypothetical protein
MPATHTFQPASIRQSAFIDRLVAERSAETLAPFEVELARYRGTREIRRDLIDRLMATPRQTAAPTESAVAVPGPSERVRAGRMLRAGSIEATVTLPNGDHVTVTIRTRKRSGRGWTNGALGDGRTSITVLGRKVGWVEGDALAPRVVFRTRRDELVTAINAVFAYAADAPLPASAKRVQEASRCGRCFRVLTDPVSIDRGIGPECFGRSTGSHHARVDAMNVGDVAAPLAADEALAVLGETRPETQAEYDAREAEMNRLVAEGEREADRIAYEAEAAEERRAIREDANALARQMRQSTVQANFVRHLDESGEPIEARRPRPSLVELAERATAPAATPNRPAASNVERAREIIAEALDAYCEDNDRDFAMQIFNQLAGR